MADKKKLLIVEDDAPHLQVLSRKAADDGYDVILAHNGEEGFKLAESIKPDVMITDIIMPVMDGLTMLAKIRQTEWGKNLPVIMLTNLNGEEQSKQAEDLGVQKFLVKSDVSLEQVMQEVARA